MLWQMFLLTSDDGYLNYPAYVSLRQHTLRIRELTNADDVFAYYAGPEDMAIIHILVAYAHVCSRMRSVRSVR